MLHAEYAIEHCTVPGGEQRFMASDIANSAVSAV